MDGYTGSSRELDRPAPRAVIEAQFAPASTSFHDIWGALIRRRGIVALAFAIVVVFGSAVTLMRPRLYEATALLMMSPREPEGVVTTQPDQNGRPPDSGYVDSQVEILHSPALAAQLVQNLHLESDP